MTIRQKESQTKKKITELKLSQKERVTERNLCQRCSCTFCQYLVTLERQCSQMFVAGGVLSDVGAVQYLWAVPLHFWSKSRSKGNLCEREGARRVRRIMTWSFWCVTRLLSRRSFLIALCIFVRWIRVYFFCASHGLQFAPVFCVWALHRRALDQCVLRCVFGVTFFRRCQLHGWRWRWCETFVF